MTNLEEFLEIVKRSNSMAEAAREMGISREAVRTRLKRAGYKTTMVVKRKENKQ